MGDDNGYNSISGTLTLTGDANPPNNRTVQVSLTRDQGSRYSGSWNVDQNASESRLQLPVTSGNWRLDGWCDDAGDHNNIKLLPNDSSSAVVTLQQVDSSFLNPWTCGGNFAGSGVHRNGTGIDYQLGVLCV